MREHPQQYGPEAGEPEPGKGEAMSTVAGIEAQVMVMGNNDHESGTFRTIKRDLESGRLSPEEAVTQARAVMESKDER